LGVPVLSNSLRGDMSIYTKQQLLDTIDQLDELTLRETLRRLVALQTSKTISSKIAAIVLNRAEEKRQWFELSPSKVISEDSMARLSQSKMKEFTRPIIKAALRNDGPFQSREILMVAALEVDKAFYMTESGIEKRYKEQAGHILTLAGFERVSHYCKQRKQPIKAWKLRKDMENFTIEQRVELVYSTLASPVKALELDDLI
jgi:hypothetical protein